MTAAAVVVEAAVFLPAGEISVPRPRRVLDGLVCSRILGRVPEADEDWRPRRPAPEDSADDVRAVGLGPRRRPLGPGPPTPEVAVEILLRDRDAGRTAVDQDPTAGPWDSPKRLTLNILPKLFIDPHSHRGQVLEKNGIRLSHAFGVFDGDRTPGRHGRGRQGHGDPVVAVRTDGPAVEEPTGNL